MCLRSLPVYHLAGAPSWAGGLAGDLAGSTSKASSQVGRHAKVHRYCCTCTMQGWWVSAVHASDFKLYLLYACLYLSAFLIRVRVALTVRAGGGFQLQRGAARYHRTAPHRSCIIAPCRTAPHRTKPHAPANRKTTPRHHGSVLHMMARVRVCFVPRTALRLQRRQVVQFNHNIKPGIGNIILASSQPSTGRGGQ